MRTCSVNVESSCSRPNDASDTENSIGRALAAVGSASQELRPPSRASCPFQSHASCLFKSCLFQLCLFQSCPLQSPVQPQSLVSPVPPVLGVVGAADGAAGDGGSTSSVGVQTASAS